MKWHHKVWIVAFLLLIFTWSSNTYYEYATGIGLTQNPSRVFNIDSNSMYSAPAFYTRSGRVYQKMKVLCDTISASAATQSIDISFANFSKILSVQLQVELNTNQASNVPLIGLKSWTTSSITSNTVQSNSSVVSILGVNVIGLQFLQSTSGIKLHLTIIGY